MLTGYEILSAEHADQETVTDKNPETDVNTKLL